MNVCSLNLVKLTQRYRIGEQESKAIRHVYQLGLLALKTNRTLVLPPMWKSRFGTCYRNPFSYYYHDKALSRYGIPSTTFESFQSWTSLRFTRPAARIYEVLSSIGEQHRSSRVLQHIAISESIDNISKGKRNHCLNDKAPRVTFGSSAISIYPLEMKWHLKQAAAVGLANDLVTLLKEESEDVVAVTWELRYPLFPVSANLHLEYAPRWAELAQLMANNIAPFIAIHWRMETVPVRHMQACAFGLVSTITSILHRNLESSFDGAQGDITTVYLATDYPLEGVAAVAHSGTFKDVNEAHHSAVNILKNAFSAGGLLSSLQLTSLGNEISRNKHKSVPHYQEMDPGLKGILDKMVVSRADWFIGGTKDCSRQRFVVCSEKALSILDSNPRSSFTGQIISSRQANDSLRNVVDYFGMVHSS